MLICHIDSKFSIVDVQAVILISHKSPMQTMLRCIGFECIEFVFYLAVYVFVLAFAFTAFGLNYPDGAIYFTSLFTGEIINEYILYTTYDIKYAAKEHKSA